MADARMDDGSRTGDDLRVELVREPHARDLPLPRAESPGAAGVDLRAAVDAPVRLDPGERRLIPTGLRIALPAGFEAQVLNFSDLTSLRQDWTTNLQTLLTAVQLDQDIFRNNTAFYDGIGNTLYREAPGLGLSDRCRPVRMLLAYTDGRDNASFIYNKNTSIWK